MAGRLHHWNTVSYLLLQLNSLQHNCIKQVTLRVSRKTFSSVTTKFLIKIVCHVLIYVKSLQALPVKRSPFPRSCKACFWGHIILLAIICLCLNVFFSVQGFPGFLPPSVEHSQLPSTVASQIQEGHSYHRSHIQGE